VIQRFYKIKIKLFVRIIMEATREVEQHRHFKPKYEIVKREVSLIPNRLVVWVAVGGMKISAPQAGYNKNGRGLRSRCDSISSCDPSVTVRFF
jgi:hypothetical protein